MKNKFSCKVLGTWALLAPAIICPTARGAGLWLYEMGTPDVGTATAGLASRASDATTAFANPAGMTRLTQSQPMVGVQPLYAHIKFDTQRATFGGGTAAMPAAWFPPEASPTSTACRTSGNSV